jgi:hypothetical protein
MRLPRIRFSDLPRGIWQHLLERVEQRQVSLVDLIALQAWVKTEPEAPEGDWYKDFGSFLLCGTGELPKTVLAKSMKPFGKKID